MRPAVTRLRAARAGDPDASRSAARAALSRSAVPASPGGGSQPACSRHRHRLRLHPDLHRRAHRRHRTRHGRRFGPAQHLAEPRRCDRRGRCLVHRGLALPHTHPPWLRNRCCPYWRLPVGPVGVRTDRTGRRPGGLRTHPTPSEGPTVAAAQPPELVMSAIANQVEPVEIRS
jgi:hypothetical protein